MESHALPCQQQQTLPPQGFVPANSSTAPVVAKINVRSCSLCWHSCKASRHESDYTAANCVLHHGQVLYKVVQNISSMCSSFALSRNSLPELLSFQGSIEPNKTMCPAARAVPSVAAYGSTKITQIHPMQRGSLLSLLLHQS